MNQHLYLLVIAIPNLTICNISHPFCDGSINLGWSESGRSTGFLETKRFPNFMIFHGAYFVVNNTWI